MIGFMRMQVLLEQKIHEALSRLGIEGVSVVVEYPAELARGDYATNAALAAATSAGMNPRELAEKIVAELGTIEHISKIETAGPGFINFHLSRDYFSNVVLKVDDTWGNNNVLAEKKILVEYSQPNPFKPFHIGHLMSTAIGESISRLVEKSGAQVFRANYQGDIGLHIAKALWAIQNGNFNLQDPIQLGDAYAYGHAQFEDDETAKQEIIELNKKIAAQDPSIQDVYQAGYQTSMEHFEELYALLGTKFDHYFFESQALPMGLELVERGKAEGIFEESDGAIVFKGEQYGLHTRVFVTQFGTTTYETRDLGLPLLKKKEFDFDESITVTAVEQKTYFEVVFKVFSLLVPDFRGVLKNVNHGMMQLATGKMSSRKGNVITGESLVSDMRTMALQKMEGRELGDEKSRIADAVGVGAIKYIVLKQSLGKNIAFDPEQSLSFEGDSGPYLQYAYTRARSVLEKAENKKTSPEVTPEVPPEVERLLPRFPSVVERAAREYEPHYVTTYLTELASAFNSWYAQEKIIGDEHEAYKLALTRAFAQTMKNGLWLLGIQAPEKM